MRIAVKEAELETPTVLPEAEHDAIAAAFQARANALRDGTPIDLQTEEELIVPLRPDAFRRCLNNLIANARRYAQSVSLHVQRRGSSIEILVDDDGPGIPESQREEAGNTETRKRENIFN